MTTSNSDLGGTGAPSSMDPGAALLAAQIAVKLARQKAAAEASNEDGRQPLDLGKADQHFEAAARAYGAMGDAWPVVTAHAAVKSDGMNWSDAAALLLPYLDDTKHRRDAAEQLGQILDDRLAVATGADPRAGSYRSSHPLDYSEWAKVAAQVQEVLGADACKARVDALAAVDPARAAALREGDLEGAEGAYRAAVEAGDAAAAAVRYGESLVAAAERETDAQAADAMFQEALEVLRAASSPEVDELRLRAWRGRTGSGSDVDLVRAADAGDIAAQVEVRRKDLSQLFVDDEYGNHHANERLAALVGRHREAAAELSAAGRAAADEAFVRGVLDEVEAQRRLGRDGASALEALRDAALGGDLPLTHDQMADVMKAAFRPPFLRDGEEPTLRSAIDAVEGQFDASPWMSFLITYADVGDENVREMITDLNGRLIRDRGASGMKKLSLPPGDGGRGRGMSIERRAFQVALHQSTLAALPEGSSDRAQVEEVLAIEAAGLAAMGGSNELPDSRVALDHVMGVLGAVADGRFKGATPDGIAKLARHATSGPLMAFLASPGEQNDVWELAERAGTMAGGDAAWARSLHGVDSWRARQFMERKEMDPSVAEAPTLDGAMELLASGREPGVALGAYLMTNPSPKDAERFAAALLARFPDLDIDQVQPTKGADAMRLAGQAGAPGGGARRARRTTSASSLGQTGSPSRGAAGGLAPGAAGANGSNGRVARNPTGGARRTGRPQRPGGAGGLPSM